MLKVLDDVRWNLNHTMSPKLHCFKVDFNAQMGSAGFKSFDPVGGFRELFKMMTGNERFEFKTITKQRTYANYAWLFNPLLANTQKPTK